MSVLIVFVKWPSADDSAKTGLCRIPNEGPELISSDFGDPRGVAVQARDLLVVADAEMLWLPVTCVFVAAWFLLAVVMERFKCTCTLKHASLQLLGIALVKFLVILPFAPALQSPNTRLRRPSHSCSGYIDVISLEFRMPLRLLHGVGFAGDLRPCISVII